MDPSGMASICILVVRLESEEWAGGAEQPGGQAGRADCSAGGPRGAAADHQHPVQVTEYCTSMTAPSLTHMSVLPLAYLDTGHKVHPIQ